MIGGSRGRNGCARALRGVQGLALWLFTLRSHSGPAAANPYFRNHATMQWLTLACLSAVLACWWGSLHTQAASVQAGDGSVGVVIDDTSGIITAIRALAPGGGKALAYPVAASTAAGGTRPLSTTVTAPAAGQVVVRRVQCMPGEDLPCARQQVVVTETFTAQPDGVVWTVAVTGLDVNATAPTAPWSTPVTTEVTFANAGPLKLWAPWERGDDRDALLPSDGHFSW